MLKSDFYCSKFSVENEYNFELKQNLINCYFIALSIFGKVSYILLMRMFMFTNNSLLQIIIEFSIQMHQGPYDDID